MVANDKRKQVMLVVERLAANRRFHEITLDNVEFFLNGASLSAQKPSIYKPAAL